MPRTFAIPDVHGNCRTFRQLLFGQIKLKKCDTLYLLGDYIDRGPDSKGVIDTIVSLQSEGYDLQPIRGNHEQMLIDFLESASEDLMDTWLYNGGEETLESYENAGMEFMPEDHLNFIFALPLLLESSSDIFVHAGLDFTLQVPMADTSREFMLWNREDVAFDVSKTCGKKIIAGHSIKSLTEIEESLKTHFIQLDNGCYLKDKFQDYGHLVALELNSNHLYVQENIDAKGMN